MNGRSILKHLGDIYERTPGIEISAKDKIVIFSDLHMGDGTSRDDFAHNGDFFLQVLRDYYLARSFHLVLNGDVEELHRFTLKSIYSRWQGLYEIWQQFFRRDSLTRLLGNHDCRPVRRRDVSFNMPLLQACKLMFKGSTVFILHGHQAGLFYRLFQPLSTFAVRFIFHPLGIKNYSVAFNSRKRYKFEKRVYDFAREKRILAVIGHTHRPLFESLSRVDSLKFEIENMCRAYPSANAGEQEELAQKIRKYKQELQELLHKRRRKRHSETLYAQEPMVPCLFNSGCCIGKNGLTAIEICAGNIELVHWFDRRCSTKYLNTRKYAAERLAESDFFRASLKQESLGYVFSRIKLLS